MMENSSASFGPNGAANAAVLAVARGRDDLPLIHQVGVGGGAAARCSTRSSSRRCAACGRARSAHAHLHARRHAGLTAVDAGHAQLRQPAAPGAVGQGSAASATMRSSGEPRWRMVMLHFLVAGGLGAVVAFGVGIHVADGFGIRACARLEVVVGPVEVLRLAAHHSRAAPSGGWPAGTGSSAAHARGWLPSRRRPRRFAPRWVLVSHRLP